MPSRYQALGALWLFQFVNFLDRSTLSFAGPSMTKSLGLTSQDFGVVLAAFSLGYLVAQLPGGMLADRVGTKFVFVLTPILWAACTGAVGLVAGLAGLVTARLCLGLAEGIGNAAIFKFIGDVFAPHERTKASALWATSIALAPAVGGPLIAMLLTTFDWRATFVLLAVPTLGVALLNHLLVPRSPRVRPDHGVGAERTPLSHLIRHRALWLLALAYFFYNVGYWGYVGWMPSYLASAHHIDLKSVGMVAGIPYLFGLLGLIVMGWLADGPAHGHRAQLWAGSFVGAGACLYLAYGAGALPGALAGLSGAAFFVYGSLALFAGILIDFAPAESRASFSALVTTAGQSGGVVAPLVIGALVERTGSYAGGFGLMIAALVAAAGAALGLLAVRRPEPQAQRASEPARAA